jgi:hypothetical protein
MKMACIRSRYALRATRPPEKIVYMLLRDTYLYYWDVPAETIYMLLAYSKNKQEDLTPTQLKMLRQLIKDWLE